MSRVFRKLSALSFGFLGVAALFAFVAQPGIVILILWVAAEVAAYDSDFHSFDAFALNRKEDAQLRALTGEAADVAETLGALGPGERASPESDRLAARYLLLQTRIMDLTERPPARFRRWSFRRGGRFALRLTLLAGVLFGGSLIYVVAMYGLPLADGRRYFDVFLYVWSATALPYALGARRSAYERGLGDVSEFLAHWDIGAETIDAHVNSLLRERHFRREAPPKSEAPPREPPHEAAEPPPAARPKRPWHVVLEVSADADQDTIHSAYWRQMMLYHPDRTQGLGKELRDLADVITLEIQKAYEEAKIS